jgi:hypothetical protein
MKENEKSRPIRGTTTAENVKSKSDNHSLKEKEQVTSKNRKATADQQIFEDWAAIGDRRQRKCREGSTGRLQRTNDVTRRIDS